MILSELFTYCRTVSTDADPDPHNFVMLGPLQSEKLCPDPHRSQTKDPDCNKV
jgi:hypothetical protein